MKQIVLATMSFGGILLIAVGVFIFANVLSGRTFNLNGMKLPNDADTSVFCIALGTILFGLSVIISRFLGKKK
jgi:hypothetical protein